MLRIIDYKSPINGEVVEKGGRQDDFWVKVKWSNGRLETLLKFRQREFHQDIPRYEIIEK